MEISEEQYEAALARIDELLKVVNDDTPDNDPNLVELLKASDLVIKYENIHYPIGGERIQSEE